MIINKQRFVQGLLCAAALQVFCIGCAGCNISADESQANVAKDSIAIMTWNLQALFDGTEDGTEYAEYFESEGWSQEKYRGRLNVISAAIEGMSERPDIIAMQEVESSRVMHDLAEALSRFGYNWTHFANIPGMALGVGLLSRFPLDETKSHSVYIDGEIAPRPMLEARVLTSGKTAVEPEANDASIILFVCHWKSKLGGEDVTESTRRASARIILRRIRELEHSESNIPVIVMGDLNENHDEFYRRSGTDICALLPDDPRSAQLVNLYGLDGSMETGAIISELQKDFIIISKQKPPVPKFFPDGVQMLYSPWTDDLEDGSYYYKNNWETIDHFLLSGHLFDGTGWDYSSCKVINVPPFASAKGFPVAYNPRTGYGLSDHLPLMLFLKRQ
ncbi:MAG: endonuclease/exonuclease/phosphatase family protein [Treponema sp.]|nr:endonuclease/exonuclease/phosphatase family protein [Treponema sp.]